MDTSELVYTYLQVIELRRMKLALENHFDSERSSMLNWMLWSNGFLTVMALLMPILINCSGNILAIYALMLFVGLFYMWLQFVGYIRSSAARRMREAEENEEDVRSDTTENGDSLGSDSNGVFLHVEEAANRWIAENRHLNGDITIKMAAKEMGVPSYQLTAWLKTTEYELYKSWITHHRIESAKQLLKERPDWGNEAIAQACGFGSRNYFQTVFKKITGLSPTEYQRKDENYTQ